MIINEFGTENEKSLLLIATAALEPDWAFMPAIELLARDYHVYAAVADGHSAGGSYAAGSKISGSTEDSTSAAASVRSFTSVERTAADIDFTLGRRGVTHLDAAYGLSMGGAILLRFLTTSGIKVDKAIIDGGITPYPYPAWICRLISLRDFALAWPMTKSRKFLEMVAPPEKYTPAGHDPAAEYDALMDFYRKTYKARSIYNDFWSANNYDLPHPAPALDTEIIYWYAEKEAKARREDMDFLKGYLSNVTFAEIPGYEHGELVMVYPDDFYRIFTETMNGALSLHGKTDSGNASDLVTSTNKKEGGVMNKKLWDLYAPIYKRAMKSDQHIYEFMYQRIPEVIRGKEVLEIATGPGLLAKHVAYAAKRIVAMDYSDGMIAVAKKGYNPPNLTFEVADAMDLPYEDDSFDAVIIANALHIVPDPEKVLSEIDRVLRPGGLLIAPNFVEHKGTALRRIWSGILQIAGVRFEHQWTAGEYLAFLAQNGWTVSFSKEMAARIAMVYTECSREA